MDAVSQQSYMKSLFFGEIREELIFPYPEMAADERENVTMILDSVQRFARERVRSAEWDEEAGMPQEIVAEMAALGLMGLAVPEELGGLGLSQKAYSRVFAEVAGLEPSLAVTLGGHQSIGYKAVLLFGTDEQKKRFLPRLASGELVACYCLTEPGSGSDAASIQTKAVLSPDGKYYVLTGNKLWITNGGIANFMTVFAKVDDKVTCFVVELPSDGVTVGPKESKLGIRASWTNAVHFDQVRVPVENLVGEVGKGFKVAMGVLNHGRMGLAAGCVGGAKQALGAAIAHVNERVQFKKKIGEFELIQEKIARMTMDIYAAESMVRMTTAFMDRGDIDYSLESAIAKVFASEMIWEVADETLQIWGGAGYMKEYPYEKFLRDARINKIFEGTNEILRAFIALSGMQGPAQELAGLAEAIKYPLKGLGPVSDFALKKIRRTVFGERMTKPHPYLKKLSGLMEEYTVEFANQVEGVIRRHGRGLHLKQFDQKRVAEVAIDLYAMSCVLSRVHSVLEREGDPAKCELELAVAEGFFWEAGRRIRSNFRAFLRNEDRSTALIASKMYEKEKYPFESL